MTRISEQKRLPVVCTKRGEHPARRVGDALLYLYEDGSAYAAFDQDGWKSRASAGPRTTGIYFGPQRTRGVQLGPCPTCGLQRRPAQALFNTAVADSWRNGVSLFDISLLP